MNRIFVAGITGFALLLCAGLMFDAEQAQAGRHHRRGGCNGGGGGLFANHRGGCGGGHHRQRGRGNDCCGQANVQPVCCEPAPAPSCCGAPAPSCCGQAVSSPCNGCGDVGYAGGAVAGCANCGTTMDAGQIVIEGGSPSNAPVMQAPQGQQGYGQPHHQGQPQQQAQPQPQQPAPQAPPAPEAPAAPAPPAA